MELPLDYANNSLLLSLLILPFPLSVGVHPCNAAVYQSIFARVGLGFIDIQDHSRSRQGGMK